MKTKLFTLLFALVTSTTFSYAAIINGICGDNLTWSLNTKDSTLTIEGSGDMSLWSYAPWYEYRSYINYVSLPNELTSIGAFAFRDCSGLTSVTIPENVTSIGRAAFYECIRLTSIEIPNSVTSLGEYAFFWCIGLTSVKLPNNITSISNSLFNGCNRLASVEIPSSVTAIGNEAFFSCCDLTSITIPNGVTSLGNGAFNNCYNLTSLSVWATTPPAGGISCGINAGKCTLYVPAEAIETYANAVWWEDFMQIKSIEGNLFTVDFKDWNGLLLARRFVEYGKAAVAPTAPTREGYTFIGWDKDFSNVTNDLIVTALYKEWTPANYNFVFLNGTDNSLIGSKQVDFTLPIPPDVAGFTFSKWFVVAGEFENQIVFIAIYEYTGVSNVLPNEVSVPGNSNQKLIREGSVYILTSDKVYTVTGQSVQ